jgi:hypothetical protein
MAGKPAEPRRAEDARTDGNIDARAPSGQDEPERTGPLTLERLVKGDGRALILYSEDPAARRRP